MPDEKIKKYPRNRKAAASAGERFYIGEPCIHCGEKLRMVHRGWCATCRAKWLSDHGITAQAPSKKIAIDRVHADRALRQKDFDQAWVDDYYRD